MTELPILTFWLTVEGDGPSRRWCLHASRPARTLEIPLKVAQDVVDTILTTVSKPMLHSYPVEGVAIDDAVWVRMPIESAKWELTDPEALSFAGAISVLLHLSC